MAHAGPAVYRVRGQSGQDGGEQPGVSLIAGSSASFGTLFQNSLSPKPDFKKPHGSMGGMPSPSPLLRPPAIEAAHARLRLRLAPERMAARDLGADGKGEVRRSSCGCTAARRGAPEATVLRAFPFCLSRMRPEHWRTAFQRGHRLPPLAALAPSRPRIVEKALSGARFARALTGFAAPIIVKKWPRAFGPMLRKSILPEMRDLVSANPESERFGECSTHLKGTMRKSANSFPKSRSVSIPDRIRFRNSAKTSQTVP